MAHISMETLLNSIARSDNKRFTHAELARALNVSEQVITNWAKRGISNEGALAAQLVFQKDANFVLGRVSHPMMLPRSAPPGRKPIGVMEDAPGYLPAPRSTPLVTELLDLFGKLDDDGKRDWVADLRGYVRGRYPHQDGDAPAVAGKE